MNWIEISNGNDGRRWVNMDRALDIEQFRDGDRQETVGRVRFGNDHYAYWYLYTQADMDRALQAISRLGQMGIVKDKADEPEPVPEFKIGERFFVMRMPHSESDGLPKSFVLTEKLKTNSGNIYLQGVEDGHSVSFDVRQCYRTWNDVAKALGVEL